MKKIFFLLLILFLFFTNVYSAEDNQSSWFGVDMDFEMDFDMGMDDFWDNLEKSLEASFLNWETSFDEMMNDFETNLENNLSAMETEIENMMNTFSTKLENDLSNLELQLEELTIELPNKIVNALDTKLDRLFVWLEEQLGNTEEYMDLLNKLTDKITTLEDSWKITNDILGWALNMIKVNTQIQKDLIVMDNIDTFSWINIADLWADNIEMVKWLFDWLELSY